MIDTQHAINLHMWKSAVSSRLALRCLARALAFMMILVLLTVRLGSFGEQVFVTPVETAIFDIASVTDNHNNPHAKPSALKYKCTLDCVLSQTDLSLPNPFQVPLSPSAHIPSFFPREIGFEIFIPPEALV